MVQYNTAFCQHERPAIPCAHPAPSPCGNAETRLLADFGIVR